MCTLLAALHVYITTYTPPFPSYAWMDKYSSSIVPHAFLHHISWPTLISLKYFERGRRFQDRGRGVCLVRGGVGAGSQKGWDGLDGGGEITNFAERETELLWKCLGKQVRASFHLLPALCPTLLSPLLWKADHREKKRKCFENPISSLSKALIWGCTIQIELHSSMLHFHNSIFFFRGAESYWYCGETEKAVLFIPFWRNNRV